jgi:hypothetical protein
LKDLKEEYLIYWTYEEGAFIVTANRTTIKNGRDLSKEDTINMLKIGVSRLIKTYFDF